MSDIPLDEKVFPRGFRSWMEVHHEVVAHIVSEAYVFPDKPSDTCNDYNLAEIWTDEFENLHVETDWEESDFWITIEAFMGTKIKQYRQENGTDDGIDAIS